MKTINRLINKIKELLHTPLDNQKGIVLPIILMAIGGLSLIGAAAVSVTTGEIGISNNDKMYKSALNLAEAGIADANDGIQGNRALVPQPIGSVINASYSFNTALASGRYNVIIELPVLTSISATSLMGASSVVVNSLNNLGPGDTIIIGNTTIHMMAKIGSIDRNTNTLYLLDGRNLPYPLPYQADAGMLVAKNTIRITSTGQSGSGLTGGTLAAWRSIAPDQQTVTDPPAGGIVRSTATLQGDYAMQEIQIFNDFDAGQLTNPGSKFNGPILVTASLTVNQYTKGDFSGPIFMSGPTAGARFTTTGGTVGNLPSTDPTFPKGIKIPLVTTTANTMITQAKNSATCYQASCSVADAKQQIYYLNGYQVDVKPYRGSKNIANLPFDIDEDSVIAGNGTLTFSFELKATFILTSAENLTVVTANPGPPATPIPAGNNLTISNVTSSDPNITLTAGQIKFDGGGGVNAKTYTQGTIVTITVSSTNVPAAGTYVWLFDNSRNIPGFSGGVGYSDGVWMTKLGNVESQAKQGDVNVYGDAGAGTHPNHNTIVGPNAPTTYYRGIYATSDTASSTAAPTAAAPYGWVTGEGALLFGGKKRTSTLWKVGDTASYYTTYFIHTNAVGSCNDHDIEIVSYTKVTYLGTSTKCGEGGTRGLFLYETIWNHTPANTFNQGVQPDDTDTKLGYIPHKGYFKWVRDTEFDGGDKNKLFKGVEVLMGDKEFNSVFNHSSDNRFTSAVINANISKIRMIGWSNPPLTYNGANQMVVSPIEFASAPVWPTATNPVIANSINWDWPDMVGTRSQFTTAVNKRGFDFSNFSTVMNSFNSTTGYIEAYQTSPGTYKLPDMSTINAVTSTTNSTGTGSIKLYSTGADPTTTWPGAWGLNGTVAMPGNPIMNSGDLKTTIITATISGPNFTKFEVKRGSANLFFDAANGIPFNINELTIETKGAGANITIGTSTNPATVFANKFEVKSEDCGGLVNFNFTGKMVAAGVEFEKNVKYNIDTTITSGTCLSSGSNYIYLKKQSWKELRN